MVLAMAPVMKAALRLVASWARMRGLASLLPVQQPVILKVVGQTKVPGWPHATLAPQGQQMEQEPEQAASVALAQA